MTSWLAESPVHQRIGSNPDPLHQRRRRRRKAMRVLRLARWVIRQPRAAQGWMANSPSLYRSELTPCSGQARNAVVSPVIFPSPCTNPAALGAMSTGGAPSPPARLTFDVAGEKSVDAMVGILNNSASWLDGRMTDIGQPQPRKFWLYQVLCARSSVG